MARWHVRARRSSKRERQTGRTAGAAFRTAPARRATVVVGRDRFDLGAVCRSLRGIVWRPPLYVREQFPGAKALVQLRRLLECVQTARRRSLCRRKGGAL